MKSKLILTALILCISAVVHGQTTSDQIRQANISSVNPTNAEVYKPLPNVVVPGKTFSNPPSDAIILFDGKNLDEWVSGKDSSKAAWKIANDVLTVNKASGDIQTKRKFTSYQLHIEWKIPAEIRGEGQERGNSGVFLSGRYEIQVLDNFNNDNKTYVNEWQAVYIGNQSL